MGSIHRCSNLTQAENTKKKQKVHDNVGMPAPSPSTRLKTGVDPRVSGLRLSFTIRFSAGEYQGRVFSVDDSVEALPGRFSTGCVFTPRYPVK